MPDKLGLVEMRNPFHEPPGYHARPLFDDLADSARITALRAAQVHGLYDYVDGYWTADPAWRQARLQAARAALDTALALVQAREAEYRVDPERIAGWRENPTAYVYGYLWTVRSLYFWFRDEGKAVEIPVSPCYRNVINPVDVGMGEGMTNDAATLLADVFAGVPGIGSIAECLAAPAVEPSYSHSP